MELDPTRMDNTVERTFMVGAGFSEVHHLD
jgi:hypothetical protein